MIVVDTNIVMHRCMRSDFTAAASALAVLDSEWHAPQLWRSEFRNVLAGAIRRGMELEMAHGILADAERCIGPNEHAIENAPVLRLIAASQCSAYDLEFVALAQELRAPLYTMDRQLLASFPGLARPLTSA